MQGEGSEEREGLGGDEVVEFQLGGLAAGGSGEGLVGLAGVLEGETARAGVVAVEGGGDGFGEALLGAAGGDHAAPGGDLEHRDISAEQAQGQQSEEERAEKRHDS